MHTPRRLVVLGAILTACSVSFLGTGSAGARTFGGGPIVAPGSTPSTAPCTNHGTVVWMVYAKLDTIPSSGACWTLVRPVTADSGSYKTCDVSNTVDGKVIGTGTTWMYDDVNTNGHSYSSGTYGSHLTDSQANTDYCSGRTSYFGVFMAASGGFHYAWTPTFDFEENYDSSHNFVSYTLSTSLESGVSGSPGSYNPVPTVDAATSSLSSHIAALCYESPDFTSDFYFGIYNGTEVSSATVSAIETALNNCYF